MRIARKKSSSCSSGSLLDALPPLLAIRAERARRSLARFVELTSPWAVEAWQELLCARLGRIPEERGVRLLVHGPPQFGKSVIVSQRFPCWALGKHPKTRVRLACYNETHACRFSRVNLELMRAPEYLATFPDPATRVPAICAADEWSTAARKEERDAQSSFRAMGLGSGFTGTGADLLLVDDPYKNREEAYSEAINEGIWDWWRDVVVPRMNPATNVVVMFHRWRDDDLAGRLLAQGGWEHLRFPAIADGLGDDPTGRAVGEPLSKRYPVPYLKQIEQDNPSGFTALYQGTPVPEGGNLFKESWFGRYRELPPLKAVWTAWDLALKEKQANDETACVVLGVGEDGQVYVLDMWHGREQTPAVQKRLIAQTDRLRATWGLAFRGDYVEDKVSGTTLMQYLAQKRPDIAVIPVAADVDKVARAHGVTPLCETGRVLLPDPATHPEARRWVNDFLFQLTRFPGAKFDDIVDAFVYALGRLRYLFDLETSEEAFDEFWSDEG